MPPFTSRRRLAQAALPVMFCAALAAGALRAHSAQADAATDTDVLPLIAAADPPPTGAVPQDPMHRGAPSPGDDPAGTAPSGTAPSGTAPSGTAPSGTAPSGTAPSGTAPTGDLPARGARPDAAGSPDHAWGMNHAEHQAAWSARLRLRLADQLATMHVYLDVTPTQEDAWRGFSQAVLAMVPDPSAADAEPHPAMGAFDGIDHMARMIRQRAAAAEAMADAAHKLKPLLTPAQIGKANAAFALLVEQRMQHLHRWHYRDDHDGGDHDGGDHDMSDHDR